MIQACSSRFYSNSISVNFVIKLEEDAEASVARNDMRRFGEYDSMEDDLQPSRIASRSDVKYSLTEKCEYRTTWPSSLLMTVTIDKTRTCGHNRFFCIFWTPSCIEYRESRLVRLRPNCKNLCEFFDTKGTNRQGEQGEGCFLFLP